MYTHESSTVAWIPSLNHVALSKKKGSPAVTEKLVGFARRRDHGGTSEYRENHFFPHRKRQESLEMNNPSMIPLLPLKHDIIGRTTPHLPPTANGRPPPLPWHKPLQAEHLPSPGWEMCQECSNDGPMMVKHCFNHVGIVVQRWFNDG